MTNTHTQTKRYNELQTQKTVRKKTSKHKTDWKEDRKQINFNIFKGNQTHKHTTGIKRKQLSELTVNWETNRFIWQIMDKWRKEWKMKYMMTIGQNTNKALSIHTQNQTDWLIHNSTRNFRLFEVVFEC